MRFHVSTVAAVIGVLSLAASCSARTYTGSINAADKNTVYYIGKFCFNPVQGGQIKINAQGNPTSSFVLMDDQPDAWPSVTSGAVRAASVVTSKDSSRCNAFFAVRSASEFNRTLPVNTVVSISEQFRRNWFFAVVNCGDSDTLAVTSYTVSVTQGDGNPLSCEQIGKYELFATYFSFSFIAIVGLLAFARKIGVPVFSFSSPHALVLYALITFTLGLIFVLADADSQRATGDMVPQGRQSFGMFLLQVADWLLLAQSFSLCTGIASFSQLKDETNIFKLVLGAFCLTYFVLSIVTIALDGDAFNLSDFVDAQPVNQAGVGIAVLRFLLALYLAYMASKTLKSYDQSALENKSFLKIFYSATLSWQLTISIAIMACINILPFSQMISVWASTLTFNFLYITGICFLLMYRWTDAPAGTKGVGRKQPFIDEDSSASPAAAASAY